MSDLTDKTEDHPPLTAIIMAIIKDNTRRRMFAVRKPGWRADRGARRGFELPVFPNGGSA